MTRLETILTWKPKFEIKQSLLILIIRWYPIITTILVTVSILLRRFNLPYSMFISTLFGCAAFMAICWLPFSWKYGFCLWHQILLLFLFLTSIISFLKLFGLFTDINAIRIKLIINIASIGISFLAYVLLSKIKCHDNP